MLFGLQAEVEASLLQTKDQREEQVRTMIQQEAKKWKSKFQLKKEEVEKAIFDIIHLMSWS